MISYYKTYIYVFLTKIINNKQNIVNKKIGNNDAKSFLLSLTVLSCLYKIRIKVHRFMILFFSFTNMNITYYKWRCKQLVKVCKISINYNEVFSCPSYMILQQLHFCRLEFNCISFHIKFLQIPKMASFIFYDSIGINHMWLILSLTCF